MSAVSDESLCGINEFREPTVVSVRVSQSCRRSIVRRRLGSLEGSFLELAVSSTSVFVTVCFTRRRHRREEREW